MRLTVAMTKATLSFILAGIILGSPFLSISGIAMADDRDQVDNILDYWSIQLENDFFAFAGDQQYTNGIEITRLTGGTGPRWLSSLARWLPFYKLSENETMVNYSLGQKIFTPEDLTRTDVIPDDRSYAGYLYFGAALLSRSYRSEDVEAGNILEVTVGLVGPGSGADGIQEWVHDMIGGKTPMGWDNQLENEPCLGISYTRLWNFIQPGPGKVKLGVSPHITTELGNVYTFAAGGVMFRLGNNLRASFTPPSIRPGFPGVPYFIESPKFNWYLFVGHESRLVLKDIFLDGNTFSDSHRVNKERLVGDCQFGFALHKGKLRIALSIMSRTKEFANQDEFTRYGALNASFTF